MSSKFNSTYFKTDKDQLKGPQARCHDWADRSSLQFFVAVDAGPAHYEYSSYRDASAFLEAYEGVPAAERCFFEQICEGQACAEYYDIDWDLEPSASAGAAENTVVEMEQSVFAAFLRVRNQHAPEYAVTEEQCRVLSASSSKKVSLHISVPTIVFENNHRHMKAFMLAFQATWRASLDAELLQHIDMGVYSKNRLMRILGSHKSKDPSRPLQRTRWHAASMAAEDSEFLLTNTRPGSVRIASIPDATAVRVQSAPQTQHKPPRAVQSSLPEWIVDAVRAKFMRTPYAAQFEMKCVTDRALIFKLERKAPGRCVVCNRDHDRENAFLKLTESGAVFLHCHRSSDLAGVEVCKRDCALEIGILTAESPHAPPGLVQADITDDARYLTHRHLAPLPEPLKLGRGKLEICGQQPPSLLIRCDTGGGKTVFTEKLVAANKKSRFVAVTCRRTLAGMLEARLGFENYQNLPNMVIARERLVVQAESLYKLDMKFYREDTILILDEVSSLIKQMCSDKTHGRMHNLNLQFFERLIIRAARVVCLDADLSPEDIEIMKSLRSDFIVINNTFQQQMGDRVVLFESQMRLIKEAQKLLQDGKRIWISSTMSATQTEGLHAVFTKAGFKGVCVTKNTSEDVKQDVGKNINAVMAELDYFIHTPTISVGVDYNVENHVDTVIGLFSTHSEVDVETCMQMMRRVRHVKSKKYLVHADSATNNLPDTALGVKTWICNQLDLIMDKARASSMLDLHLDEEDELVMPDDLYHRMYCHVTAKKHLSMNGFRARLIQRATQAGCVVTANKEEIDEENPIADTVNGEVAAITDMQHQRIADAEPISQHEFEELSCGARELNADQRASVHKFALMRTYDVQEHSVVTKQWVSMYDNAHERECYRNLLALNPGCGSSLQQCLRGVQQQEELGLEYSLRGAATTANAHSRLERSQFTKLAYVVDILTACGFEGAFATNEVLAKDLTSRIDGIWAGLESNMSQICINLKKRTPRSSSWTFKTKLAFINTVLSAVLGANIVALDKLRTKYHFKHRSNVGSAESSPLKGHSAQ